MPASSSPIVLILGAGANIGTSLARTFAAKGYRVALAARKMKDETNEEGQLTIRGDFADPSSVATVFEKVRKAFGNPSVVIYNAAKSTSNNSSDPLSLSLDDCTNDMAVNTISVLAAAHQAVSDFAELPSDAARTFIYTGNGLNITPIPPLLSLGMSKSATAHMMASASAAYRDKGYKFYYADERKADGSVAGRDIDGQAHADFYLKLAEDQAQGPWLATFVKGAGYTKFS